MVTCVPDEWLSTTEPGLQAGSLFLFSCPRAIGSLHGPSPRCRVAKAPGERKRRSDRETGAAVCQRREISRRPWRLAPIGESETIVRKARLRPYDEILLELP